MTVRRPTTTKTRVLARVQQVVRFDEERAHEPAEEFVREVLVENAEPVEYGQVLFRIDPAG